MSEDDATTWRKEIADHLENYPGEEVIACTLSEDELDVKFDSGYGGTYGEHFTVWTQNRVLFPVVYDGAEWVGSVPRNPCDEKTGHWGGG